jgi:peptidoglycan hydrolase-like protein with peptidoglycan-binding domain
MNAVFNVRGFDSIVVPAPPPAPWPVFDPVHGKWGLYPIAVKPVIKEGAQGSNKDLVRYLQGVILNKAGGNIVVDGIFGPQTTKRVKELQKFFGLFADGIVGAKTWGVVDYISQL